MRAIAALITSLISERPLCVDCIATRAYSSVPAVLAYLDELSASPSVLRRDDDRCRTCGTTGKTYAVPRPMNGSRS